MYKNKLPNIHNANKYVTGLEIPNNNSVSYQKLKEKGYFDYLDVKEEKMEEFKEIIKKEKQKLEGSISVLKSEIIELFTNLKKSVHTLSQESIE